MRDKLTVSDLAKAQIIRNRSAQPTVDVINIRGRYRAEQWRKGRLIAVHEIENVVMDAAKNAMWDTYFNEMTQVVTAGWYMSLITSAGFTAISAADTMASHAGWAEGTGYTSSTRVLWGQGAAASKAITNASPVSFIANTGFTAKGLFITSGSAKSGTAGILFSAGLFTAGDAVLVSSDELRVTYTASM